jgi:hypothetical protein
VGPGRPWARISGTPGPPQDRRRPRRSAAGQPSNRTNRSSGRTRHKRCPQHPARRHARALVGRTTTRCTRRHEHPVRPERAAGSTPGRERRVPALAPTRGDRLRRFQHRGVERVHVRDLTEGSWAADQNLAWRRCARSRDRHPQPERLRVLHSTSARGARRRCSTDSTRRLRRRAPQLLHTQPALTHRYTHRVAAPSNTADLCPARRETAFSRPEALGSNVRLRAPDGSPASARTLHPWQPARFTAGGVRGGTRRDRQTTTSTGRS